MSLDVPHVRRLAAHGLALMVAVLGLLVLIGWQLDIPLLTSVGRGFVAMNPATAVAFLLSAVSLHFLTPEPARRTAARLTIAQACAIAVLMIGVLRLIAYLGGWDFGVDRLLFSGALGRTDIGVPNRMAPNTALALTTIGMALLTFDSHTRRGGVAQVFALTAGALGLLAIIGYAYSQDALYRVATFIPMAIHTAVGIVLLASAILLARLDRGRTAVLLCDSAGGAMARRLLPAAVVLPLVLGWLRLIGERAEWYEGEFGTALFVVASSIAFTALVLMTSWSLHRADGQRRRAETKLQALNQALEQRIDERTGELEHANRQLHDEARIAADLARVGRELIAALGQSALPDHLCRLTMNALESDFSHVFLWRHKEDVYVPVAGCGDTDEQWAALRPLKVPRAMVAKLIAHLERNDAVQVRMSDPEDLLPPSLPAWYGITLTLYLAIRQGDQVVGILTAGYRGRQELFTARQERTGRGIAHLASLTLENVRLLGQLERASRLKSDFVSTMSHELRTPLNAILGYTALLREGEFGEPTPKQAEVLERVERSAGALLELVQHVLDLSRLEKEEVPLDLRELSLVDLEHDLTAFANLQARGDRVRFVWRVEPPAGCVRTDGAKLKVVLKTLVDNAFKFTDDGDVTVTVRAPPGGIEIVVRDTGIGIAPEHHEAIFEPFRQLEPYLTRRYGGVGLGLYLARRLLDTMGGSIAVESGLGAGATFRVWVPQARTEPTAVSSFDAIVTAENPTGSRGPSWFGHA